MKIAVFSDEIYEVNNAVIHDLENRGHDVVRFGSLLTSSDACWAEGAQQAAMSIARGECDEGIFFCYTGTGITIAANRIASIRASLCVDAETARLARIWNHANVLTLSNRLLSKDVAKEILDAWFATPHDPRGQSSVDRLASMLA